MDGLASRMDGEFRAVHTDIERLVEKTSGEFKRLDQGIDGIDKKLE
jgi:hypothetical protein